VEVISRNGAKGFVFVDKGKISHAICEDLQGESALYKCMTFEAGSFSSQPWQGPKTVTIDKPGQFLLIEAARKRDDMRHDIDNEDTHQKAR
jgi:hypothetical protein